MQDKFNNVSELEVLLEKTDKAEIQPVFSSNAEPETDWVRVFNTTRNYTETMVQKSRGKVVNHSEAFKPLLGALEQQEGADFFGFVHNCQGRVTVEVLFNNAVVKDGSDEGIKLGMKFTNDYSRLNFRGENFGYRKFCSNGCALGKALHNEMSCSHKNIANLNKEILAFIEVAFNKTKLLEGLIEKAMVDEFINEEDALRVLVGEVTGERTAKKMLELIESQNVFSRYDIYKCITNFATHSITNDGRRRHYQEMAQKILVTSSDKLNRGELKKEKKGSN